MTLPKLQAGQVWLCREQAKRIVITTRVSADSCVIGEGVVTDQVTGAPQVTDRRWAIHPNPMVDPRGNWCYPLRDKDTFNPWALVQLIYDPNT